MALDYTYADISLAELILWAEERKAAGWVFVQMCALVEQSGTITLVYSLRKDDTLENRVLRGITEETTIPSVTSQFPAAFVFENEAHDLFGVHITGISIDFKGKFYRLAQDKPMTILSSEQTPARTRTAKPAQIPAREQAKGLSASAGVSQGGSNE